MEGILAILSDAMQHDEESRPCGMYRKLICPKGAHQKPCNDLDVIMCAIAKSLEYQIQQAHE